MLTTQGIYDAVQALDYSRDTDTSDRGIEERFQNHVQWQSHVKGLEVSFLEYLTATHLPVELQGTSKLIWKNAKLRVDKRDAYARLVDYISVEAEFVVLAEIANSARNEALGLA